MKNIETVQRIQTPWNGSKHREAQSDQTHWDALEHAWTLWDTLGHAGAHWNTREHWNNSKDTETCWNTKKCIQTHWDPLGQTVTWKQCSMSQHIKTHENISKRLQTQWNDLKQQKCGHPHWSSLTHIETLKYIEAWQNTLRHTEKHWNTLKTRRNTLGDDNTLKHIWIHSSTWNIGSWAMMKHTETRETQWNTLEHIETPWSMFANTAAQSSLLQHDARSRMSWDCQGHFLRPPGTLQTRFRPAKCFVSSFKLGRVLRPPRAIVVAISSSGTTQHRQKHVLLQLQVMGWCKAAKTFVANIAMPVEPGVQEMGKWNTLKLMQTHWNTLKQIKTPWSVLAIRAATLAQAIRCTIICIMPWKCWGIGSDCRELYKITSDQQFGLLPATSSSGETSDGQGQFLLRVQTLRRFKAKNICVAISSSEVGWGCQSNFC